MLMFILGIIFTILVYSSWELIKEYELNKYGFILVVAVESMLFGVLSFVGNAYAEGEPTGAFRAGAAALLLVVILCIITGRVLIVKKKTENASIGSKTV